MSIVSLWQTPYSKDLNDYDEEHNILQTDDFTIVRRYYAQKKRKLDKHIIPANNIHFFLQRKKGKWDYIGNVISVSEPLFDKHENKYYILTIKNDISKLSFNTKNKAAEHFNWNKFTNGAIRSGIILVN